ncbi:MAG TPA: hypothetical protein PKJ23_00485, partial [bacterium]|nr:hypothetical protein [bacterium]
LAYLAARQRRLAYLAARQRRLAYLAARQGRLAYWWDRPPCLSMGVAALRRLRAAPRDDGLGATARPSFLFPNHRPRWSRARRKSRQM